MRSLNIQHHVHKSPPMVPLLSHMNWVHTFPHPIFITSILTSSHIHLSLPSGFLPLCFPTITLYELVSHAYYVSCLSHFPLLDHYNNIWWGVSVVKLLIMCSFLQPLVITSFLGPDFPLSILLSVTLSLYPSLNMRG